MAKRHTDALSAQGGACNALALAHSLVDSIRAAREAGADWNCKNDAATLLIAHQLAFLLELESLNSHAAYCIAMRECENADNGV